MGDLRHAAELEMAATPQEVWDGLTNPVLTRRYVFGTAIDSDWRQGSEYAYRLADGTAAEEGTILEIEPGRLLRVTSRLVFTPATAGDAPHRVTWEIEPLGADRSRVRLTRDGFEEGSVSFRLAAEAVPRTLAGLRVVVDREVGAELRRLDRIGRPEVRELTPGLADEFLRFFDKDAFRDNPNWSDCYCMENHFAGTDAAWGLRTAEENRRDQEKRVRSGEARGLLAYVDGRPVGWCNAGPRTAMRRFDLFPVFQIQDAEQVGSIVCFVVAAPYRRHGVARLLLDAACDALARQGFRWAEGYPPKGTTTDAAAYRGPLELFVEAGFTTYRDSPRLTLVRKALAQA